MAACKPMVAIKKTRQAVFSITSALALKKLQQVQEYAKKKLAKLSKKLRMQTAASKDALQGLFGKGRKRGAGPQKPFSDTPAASIGPPVTINHKKRYGELLYLLSQQYPDWSHDKVRTEAHKML